MEQEQNNLPVKQMQDDLINKIDFGTMCQYLQPKWFNSI
jgi:hypothetical protein